MTNNCSTLGAPDYAFSHSLRTMGVAWSMARVRIPWRTKFYLRTYLLNGDRSIKRIKWMFLITLSSSFSGYYPGPSYSWTLTSAYSRPVFNMEALTWHEYWLSSVQTLFFILRNPPPPRFCPVCDLDRCEEKVEERILLLNVSSQTHARLPPSNAFVLKMTRF